MNKDLWYKHLYIKNIIRIILKSLYSTCIEAKLYRNNFKKLKKFKNIHAGKRLFIVATGPSLNICDLDKLKSEYTFSMNSIYKLYKKTDWRPTYYAIFDKNVFNRLKKDLYSTDFNIVFCPQYFRWRKKYVYKIPVIWDYKYLFQEYATFVEHKFSNDISKCIYTGTNVVYIIFQIAFYMGFKEIYLLGTDCTMGTYASDLNYKNSEANKSSCQTNDHIIFDYVQLKKIADENGIKVFNASRGGSLEVFERVNLDNIL